MLVMDPDKFDNSSGDTGLETSAVGLPQILLSILLAALR